MAIEATSKNLKSATEQTQVAPIKQGFGPSCETRSYATRLGHRLAGLFRLSTAAGETSLGAPPAAALDQVRMIRFIPWSVLEDPRGAQLMLAISSDGLWERYIRAIADHPVALSAPGRGSGR